jgi:hypothetical protein
MENVVHLKLVDGCGNGAVVPVNRVLAGARAAGLTDVVVIGYDENGDIYAGASHGASDTNWLIDQGKAWILAGCPAMDD